MTIDGMIDNFFGGCDVMKNLTLNDGNLHVVKYKCISHTASLNWLFFMIVFVAVFFYTMLESRHGREHTYDTYVETEFNVMNDNYDVPLMPDEKESSRQHLLEV